MAVQPVRPGHGWQSMDGQFWLCDSSVSCGTQGLGRAVTLGFARLEILTEFLRIHHEFITDAYGRMLSCLSAVQRRAVLSAPGSFHEFGRFITPEASFWCLQRYHSPLGRIERDSLMTVTMKALGIDRLSTAERLTLVEQIWESIAEEGNGAPLLSAAQAAELDRRLLDHERNPDDVIGWDEVQALESADDAEARTSAGSTNRVRRCGQAVRIATTVVGRGFHFRSRTRNAANCACTITVGRRSCRYPSRLCSALSYSLYFRVEADRIVVLAVFHGARNPIVWQRRS